MSKTTGYNSKSYSIRENASSSKFDKYNYKVKPPSLRNSGANCYLNSALQGLSSCDIFVKEINSLYGNNRDATLYGKLNVFCHLISILNGRDAGNMEISHNSIFQSWNKSGQQDSFELIAYVLNQVYSEFRKNKENEGHIKKKDTLSWLQLPLPMRIIIHYQITCGCGNFINVPLQSDLALHVTIPLRAKMDLQDLVDKFFDEDKIEDYICDYDRKCPHSSLASRRTQLCLPLPNTICVHLQRTYWNGCFMRKIDHKISFGYELIIKSQFCLSQKQREDEIFKEKSQSNNSQKENKDEQTNMAEVDQSLSETGLSSNCTVNCNDGHKNPEIVPEFESPENLVKVSLSEKDEADNETNSDKEKSQSTNSQKENKDEQTNVAKTNYCLDNKGDSLKDDEVFKLTSVIVHYGSVNFGHYVCYKCVNNQWFLTNDSRVREVDPKEVFDSQAYILFYEKC